MQDYYIMWAHAANYADKPIKIRAYNAREAVKNFAKFFSTDFQKKAKVYCFTEPPVSVWNNGNFSNED